MQPEGMSANRRLAELLGWTDIFDVGGALLGTPPPGVPACRNQAKVPDWTGDWRECGPLMVQRDVAGLIGWCATDGEARAKIVDTVIYQIEREARQ